MADLIREDYVAPSFALAADQYPDPEIENRPAWLGEPLPMVQATAQPQEMLMPLEAMKTNEIQNQAAYRSAAAAVDDNDRMRGRPPASP